MPVDSRSAVSTLSRDTDIVLGWWVTVLLSEPHRNAILACDSVFFGKANSRAGKSNGISAPRGSMVTSRGPSESKSLSDSVNPTDSLFKWTYLSR